MALPIKSNELVRVRIEQRQCKTRCRFGSNLFVACVQIVNEIARESRAIQSSDANFPFRGSKTDVWWF